MEQIPKSLVKGNLTTSFCDDFLDRIKAGVFWVTLFLIVGQSSVHFRSIINRLSLWQVSVRWGVALFPLYLKVSRGSRRFPNFLRCLPAWRWRHGVMQVQRHGKHSEPISNIHSELESNRVGIKRAVVIVVVPLILFCCCCFWVPGEVIQFDSIYLLYSTYWVVESFS